MLKRYAAIILLFIIGFTSSVQAQIVKLDNKEFNADSIRKEFDEAPHCSLYNSLSHPSVLYLSSSFDILLALKHSPLSVDYKFATR